MSKGISPLIAAVLLIAFTVSIALLAGPFFTDIIQSSQEGQTEQLDTINQGLDSDLEYTSASYNENDDTFEVTFRNSGQNNVSEFVVTVYGDENAQKTFNQTLTPSEIKTVNLSVGSTPDRVKVETLNSPTSVEKDLTTGSNFVTGSAPSSPTGLSLND